MSTSSSPPRGPFALLAVLVALAMGALTPATPAAAWASGGGSGQAAPVTLPQVSVADIGFHPQPPTLTFTSTVGPVVRRSPATGGGQDVHVFYVVERWTGTSWATVTTQRHVGAIGAGQSEARFPAVFVQPTSGTGDYRVTFISRWFAAGTGTALGDQKWVLDKVADHVCVSTRRPCTSHPGYVDIGAIT